MTLSVAACMTGKDNAKIHQLPNTRGMKDEVIIQVMQRNYYELMVRLAGASLVEIGLANGTQDYNLESAINERTAAIVHFVAYSPASDLPIGRVIEIAHDRGVPVIVDAAAEFPPFSALRRWADMGADLTIFSGGKGIRGPQSTGLILGRKDLIEACAMNASPNHGVGRPPKVGKEEIAGVVTALELFSIEEFESAEFQGCEDRARYMAEAISQVTGVRCYVEPAPPHLGPRPRRRGPRRYPDSPHRVGRGRPGEDATAGSRGAGRGRPRRAGVRLREGHIHRAPHHAARRGAHCVGARGRSHRPGTVRTGPDRQPVEARESSAGTGPASSAPPRSAASRTRAWERPTCGLGV